MSFDKGGVWVNDNMWLSFQVGGSSAISKGQVVYLDTDGKVQATTGANRKAIGVALKSGAVGEYIPVAVRGVVWVTVGGTSEAIDEGDFLVSASAGKVVELTDFSAPSSYSQAAMQTELNKIGTVIGIALDAGTTGDTIRMLLIKF